jgi:hypothetical protein
MKKIESLTSQQWAEIDKLKKQWLDNASRQPLRSDVELAVEKLYKLKDFSNPKIIYVDSPLAAVLLNNLIKENSLGDSLWISLDASLRDSMWDSTGASLSVSLGASLDASLRDSMWDSTGASLSASLGASLDASLWISLRDSLWTSLRDSLWASMRDSMGGSLWASLGGSLWDSLGDSLGDSLRDSLGASLRASLWDSLGASLRDSLGASLRASLMASPRDSPRDSLSFYWQQSHCAFIEGGAIAGVEYNKNKFADYQLICKNLSFVLPYKDLCIVAAPPIYCEWGDNGEIGSTTRAAVEYADGFKIWAIDGYRVPERVVLDPLSQTIQEINEDGNEEIKRIRIERYGWDKYLTASNATVLDFWTSPNGYLESLMQCDDYVILCTYDPSTGRPYSLEVAQSCTTCEQAQNYLLAPEIALSGLGIEVKSTYPTVRT